MAVASSAPAVGPTPAPQHGAVYTQIYLTVDPMLRVEALDTSRTARSSSAAGERDGSMRESQQRWETHLTAPPVKGTENSMTTARTAPNMSGAIGVSLLFSANQCVLIERAGRRAYRQRA